MNMLQFNLVNGGESIAWFSEDRADWIFVHFNSSSGLGPNELVWKINGIPGSASAEPGNLLEILTLVDGQALLPKEFFWPERRELSNGQRILDYLIRNSDDQLLTMSKYKKLYLDGEWLTIPNIGYDATAIPKRVFTLAIRSGQSEVEIESYLDQLAKRYVSLCKNANLKWKKFAENSQELIGFWRAAAL